MSIKTVENIWLICLSTIILLGVFLFVAILTQPPQVFTNTNYDFYCICGVEYIVQNSDIKTAHYKVPSTLYLCE